MGNGCITTCLKSWAAVGDRRHSSCHETLSLLLLIALLVPRYSYSLSLRMSSGSPPMKRQFIHAIPESRLGTSQDSLVSYFEAVDADSSCRQQEKLAHTEFSLVVLLSPNASLHNNDDNNCNIRSNISILLGKKLRGFGEGFYNCFGGKLETSRGEHDNPASGAVREVHEETGINIPLSVMDDGFVGNINFTFEDYDVNRAMKVHLYCVFISLSNDAENNASCIELNNEQYYAHTLVDPNQIRGCDEIEPSWFHNIYDLPLDQMFADDSLWLAMLLQHYDVGVDEPLPKKLMFDAWFHFHPGGATTNSIMHHFIQINNGSSSASNSPKYTLEQRLYHELHVKRIQNPSIKEFKESWTFANAVRSFLKDEDRMDYVIDVAGGHGALAALFLLLVPHCHSAIVIDPAQSTGGKKGVREAWSQFWSNENDTNSGATAKKDLRYRHECLRTGLRKELDCILQKAKSTSVTVVACHACQHLTDETLQIAAEYGVNVAVMPCCQKDHE